MHFVKMTGAFGISTFMIMLLVEIQQLSTVAATGTADLNHLVNGTSLKFNNQSDKCTLPGLDKCSCFWIKGDPRELLDSITCNGLGFTNMSVLSSVGDTVKTIVFTGNDLEILNASVLSSATNLRSLDISSNNIKTVMPGSLSGLPRLEELILNNNSWLVDEETCPKILQNIPLKKLYLNNAFARNYNATMKYVTDLRTLFGSCVLGSLEVLQLESNNLYFVDSDIFCNMPKLQTLDLSHNKISELPCNGTCLASVQDMFLHDNRLSHISHDCISEIKKPELKLSRIKLDITDNPFTCDCDILDQYEWLVDNSTSTHVYKKDKLLCRFPNKLTGQAILNLQKSDFVCPSYVSGNNKLKFLPIIFSLLFAVVAFGLLLLVFSKRHQIRNLFGGRQRSASRLTAGYSSMDA